MKQFLKRCVVLIVVLIFGTAMFAGCNRNPKPVVPENPDDPGNNPGDTKVTITLNVSETTLYVGQTFELTATVKGSTDAVEWKSSRASVATVAGDGTTATVTANGKGKCNVTAKVGGVTAKCTVTVEPEPETTNDHFYINLPAKKIILNQTGDSASVKVMIKDDTIDPAKLVYTIDEKVCTLVSYLNVVYLTAVAQGTCKLTVSYPAGDDKYEATCTVAVRKTEVVIPEDPETMETLDYYVWTKDGVKSTETYHGLSNAINALKNGNDGAGMGDGAYCTAVGDDETKMFTLRIYDSGGNAGKAYAYNFLNRSQFYNGFNSNENVVDGVADYWSGWATQLGLWKQSKANMLQLRGQYENSYYYRVTDYDTLGSDGDPANTWSGWQANVYSAAGAGVQYVSTESAEAHGLSGIEQVYDLSASVMKPSTGTQNVYSEIWASVTKPTPERQDPVEGKLQTRKYYGLYFDAQTTADTAELENGAERGWYAFEGVFARWEGLSTSNPSNRTVDSEPLAVSTWNKTKGCWETEDLTVKIKMEYHFTEEDSDENFTITYTITCIQSGVTKTKTYEWNYGAPYKPDSSIPFGFTYGVSFTPNAKRSTTDQWKGHYKNAEIPDLYNGGSWKGMKQVSATGFALSGTDLNLSLIKGNEAKYRAIWGKDVCSCVKNVANDSTEINFQY